MLATGFERRYYGSAQVEVRQLLWMEFLRKREYPHRNGNDCQACNDPAASYTCLTHAQHAMTYLPTSVFAS